MKFLQLILPIFLIAYANTSNSFAAEPPATCQGNRFAPCVCWPQVPKTVSYLPRARVCGNNAAIVLRGNLLRSFSVVMRDFENSDRVPDPECDQNFCSVFKTQKTIYRVLKGVKERVSCLGAPGKSDLFKNAARITVKVSDVPNPITGLKDLRRYCIRSPLKKLN